ncbi:MAG TPA: RraA family protein [Thermoleophilia bacterium]|nr:RraA family protein [Thermoleophilia bacterium]
MNAHSLAAELLALGAATLGESGGEVMAARIKPAWAGAAVAAPAYPVTLTPADNLAIHLAVVTAPPGSVLVVDASAEPERGYWGEVLTTAAESRGLAGLVIDGGVRDVTALAAHGFPVFSALIALRGAQKVHGGSVGRTAHVGGATVSLGDWVVGDADGVTVLAGGRLDEILAAGHARADKEARMFDELRAGATTIELLGLDPSSVVQD